MGRSRSCFICLPCLNAASSLDVNKSTVICCSQPARCVSTFHSRRAFIISLAAFAVIPNFIACCSEAEEETESSSVNTSETDSSESNSAPPDTNNNSNSSNNRTYDGKQTTSGIIFVDFEKGEGPTPEWGDLVYIQYKLYTVDPSRTKLIEHDSTKNRVKKGYFVHHGNGEHILGLEEMIHSMRKGGLRRCVIPSRLAYFQTGFAPIPTSARARRRLTKALNEGDGSIVMDIEIVSIEKDPEDRGYYSDLVPTDEELRELTKNLREEHPDPRLRSFTIK